MPKKIKTFNDFLSSFVNTLSEEELEVLSKKVDEVIRRCEEKRKHLAKK